MTTRKKKILQLLDFLPAVALTIPFDIDIFNAAFDHFPIGDYSLVAGDFALFVTGLAFGLYSVIMHHISE